MLEKFDVQISQQNNLTLSVKCHGAITNLQFLGELYDANQKPIAVVPPIAGGTDEPRIRDTFTLPTSVADYKGFYIYLVFSFVTTETQLPDFVFIITILDNLGNEVGFPVVNISGILTPEIVQDKSVLIHLL